MPTVKPAMARSPARDDARPRTGTVQAPAALLIGMDPLDVTVRSILSLAASYKPGTIVRAERVVDEYLDRFEGYPARRVAMDALLRELALPERHARNRGGLFELIELHLKRRQREMARLFQ